MFRPALTVDPDQASSPVYVLRERYPAFDGPWHAHARAQFVYATEGALTVRTRQGLWVVPPQRAVWILPGELHKGSAPRPFELRTLYAKPDAVPLPPRSCVVTVDPLLDALLTEAASYGAHVPDHGPEQRLLQVILDRLAHVDEVPSYLPLPQDPRLLRLVDTLDQDPADPRPLEVLASACGLSGRTAARRFLQETGLTFAQWRQQLRLLRALQALSRGERVHQVAADVGYQDVSAFIAVFKLTFGQTPARYFRRTKNDRFSPR